jgi:ribosomal protein S18 acetylase RimI-like enzyme
MRVDHYDEVYALWSSMPGIGLHTDAEDSREGIARYLRRNPDTCFVAEEAGRIVGAVLCGNDGRRGHINHLAVAADCRSRGIGRALVDACRAACRAQGIDKCAFQVFRNNEAGNAFWDALGATRNEAVIYRILDTEGAK